MAAVVDEGLCLRTWDWSETSQTALVLFRGSGMLKVLAKGAKRERGPFSGGLETLTRGEGRVYLKPTASLVTLGSWDLEERFDGARRTLFGFYGAMYIVDMVSHALTEADPHPPLFEAICASLREMDAAGGGGAGGDASEGVMGHVMEGVLGAQWATLVEGGHRPELHVSVEDGRELTPSEVYAFVPSEGAFMDGRSRAREIGQEVWRVRRSTVQLLRGLEDGGATRDPITIWRGVRFLHAYLRWVLGVELASFETLASTVESGGLGSGK